MRVLCKSLPREISIPGVGVLGTSFPEKYLFLERESLEKVFPRNIYSWRGIPCRKDQIFHRNQIFRRHVTSPPRFPRLFPLTASLLQLVFKLLLIFRATIFRNPCPSNCEFMKSKHISNGHTTIYNTE